MSAAGTGGSYGMGVDLGTTYTAAAIARDGHVEVAPLGQQSPVVPSVLYVLDDGSVLVGDAAARRSLFEPRRVVREFKRRFGDPTPIVVAGTAHGTDALMAQLLSWVLTTVSEREGGPPDRLAVTYPANWGPYKRDLLADALRQAGRSDALTVTEPEAAAISYAATERLDDGAVVAVYDLGGGTFDACVLRKVADGFEVLGRPEGIEHLGGVDFDEAVLSYVRESRPDAFEGLDPDDAATWTALTHLRRECTEAKEALSSDSETCIPVLFGAQSEVRLTRVQFEEMISPTLTPTVAALSRAIRSAGLHNDEVDVVLLTGGSSRIPLVGRLIAEEIGRPVGVDIDPKLAVAMGAARRAALTATPEPAPPGLRPLSTAWAEAAPTTQTAMATQTVMTTQTATAAPPASAAYRQPLEPPPATPPSNGGVSKAVRLLLIGVGLLVIALVAALATRGGKGTADVKKLVLTQADLPGGWSASARSPEYEANDKSLSTCIGVPDPASAAAREESPLFSSGDLLTTSTATRWKTTADLQRDIIFDYDVAQRCLQASYQRDLQGAGGQVQSVTIERFPFGVYGDVTKAWRITANVQRGTSPATLYLDWVAIAKGPVDVWASFSSPNQPFDSRLEQDLVQALGKRLQDA